MRRFTCPFSIAILLLTMFSWARAEDGVLIVHVANPKGQPIPGVVLSTKGDSSTGAPTSNEGKTRIKLASQTRPNSEISLQIVRAPTDMVFVSPWDGRVRVPPFDNESQNFASVILIEPGDRAWLEYGIVTLALVSKINATNSFRAGADGPTDEQRRASLSEVADSYGLKPEEVDAAIRAFGKKTEDPFGIGQVALYEKNYPEAEKQLLISKEARKKNLEHAMKELADVDFSLGQTFYEQGKYKEAVNAYQEVSNLRPDDSAVLNNLGVALAGLGDYSRAEFNFRKALLLDESKVGPNDQIIATSLSNLAGLFDMKGDFIQAEAQYKRALTVIEKNYPVGHPFAISVLDNLIQLYLKIGNEDRAIVLQESISEAIEHYLANASGPEYASLYSNVLSDEINQAVSIHVRYAPHNQAALRVAFLTVLRNKGRLIDINADQMKSLRTSFDAQDQALLEQVLAARAQLASLILNNAFLKNSELNQPSISQIEGKLERLEEAIRARKSTITNGGKPITLETIQKEIPSAGALVEFVRFRPLIVKKNSLAGATDPPRYVAYILWKEGEPQCVDLGDATSIDEAVNRFMADLRDPSSRSIQENARALYERIMRPLRMSGIIEHLIISPDGQLNLLPFSALIDQQGKYLVEDFLVSYLTSGRHLLRLTSLMKSRSAPVVIANPLFDADEGGSNKSSIMRFRRLPASDREAEAISAMGTGYTRVIGATATKSILQELHGPTILHLATHGFFLQLPKVIGTNAEPRSDNWLQSESKTRSKLLLRSGPDTLPIAASNFFRSGQFHPSLYEDYQLLRVGVALAGANSPRHPGNSDGILTALEAMGLDLVGTKLVVLSASYTALGEIRDGDGVYGFRRAIEIAGAESTITSLWDVSDEGTSSLMQRYYSQLDKGAGTCQSLRQAQLYMLADKKWRHPFYWAAFIHSGNWTPISSQ